ncbi:MAG TPA: hypothetical protein VID73_06580 [Ktedonobacterales bacterium]|jgi:hypothetical protein
MGKYKQWLHHQEVGRRLRDQIASLEQERERVGKMAPTHPTTLPELDNPIVSSLLAYTRQGNALNRGADPRAGFAQQRGDADPEPSRPAPAAPTPAAAPTAAPAAPRAQQSAVVASLQARAEQIPSDPQAQVRELARAKDAGISEADTAPTAPTPSSGSQGGPGKAGDSVGGWWKRYRPDDQA